MDIFIVKQFFVQNSYKTFRHQSPAALVIILLIAVGWKPEFVAER